MKDDEEIDYEELFDDKPKNKGPRRTARRRAKKARKDIFGDIKTRMVMRIYGVSKARALHIIAGRNSEREALEAAKGDEAPENDLMTAKDFFGGCK